MNLAFTVNNHGVVLDQEFPNGTVTVRWEVDGKVDPDHTLEISGRQFIELLRLYRRVIEGDIRMEYINPNGRHYDNGANKCRITYRMYQCNDGKYEIGRTVDKNGVRGREWHVKGVYNGNYDWTRDGFAKHFPEKAAAEHIRLLAKHDAERLRGRVAIVVDALEEYTDEN